jgi:hypothetical protein
MNDLFKNSNIIAEGCPVCGKKLRIKAPCCSDKNAYLVCGCGYKKVKNETDNVHNSSGSNDPTGMQG